MQTLVDVLFEEETAESTTVSSLPTEDTCSSSSESTPPPLASAPLHSTSTQGEAQSAVRIAEGSAQGANTVLYEIGSEAETLVDGATISPTVEISEPKQMEAQDLTKKKHSPTNQLPLLQYMFRKL